MKITVFIIGIVLLIASLVFPFKITTHTIILFALLLLITFFEEMEEFDFLGLRGKKADKELKKFRDEIGVEENATNHQKENFSEIKDKPVQLMGVDRGNYLALVFEIERLLRWVAAYFHPSEVTDKTPPLKLIALLKNNGYLTESGVKQIRGLLNVRNLIVHGRVSVEEDQKLSEWINLAFRLYAEIYKDIYGKDLVQNSQ